MNKQELVNNIQTTELCCHKCGSTNIVKRGKANGLQRYWCKDCNCTFNLATRSILSYSKKEPEKYLKYIELMQYGVSIRKAAKICEISMKTSFRWRHKFLEGLKKNASEEKLNGIVETDGTFLTLSFKGSRVLPRDPHHRGHDVKIRGISSEKVCINTACSREANPARSNIIAVPTNLGPENTKSVRELFSARICCKPDSILCSDKKVCYRNVAEDNHWNLLQFDSRKRDYIGFYNLSHINAYHQTLKDFLRPTKGVATKYLQNYINWCNYLKKTKLDFNKLIFTAVNDQRVSKIKFRPAIPFKSQYDGFFNVIGNFNLLKQKNDENDVK